MLRPLRHLSAGDDAAGDGELLGRVHPKKLLGFLSTLKDLVGQVGHQLVLHLPRIQEVLLAIVAHVFSSGGACEVPGEEEGGGGGDDVGEAGGAEADEASPEYRDKVLDTLRGLFGARVCTLYVCRYVHTHTHTLTLSLTLVRALSLSPFPLSLSSSLSSSLCLSLPHPPASLPPSPLSLPLSRTHTHINRC